MYCFNIESSLCFFFPVCRMKTLIQSQRSGRTTLKRRWDLLGALSVTTTSANMRCSLKLCSRAEVLETSGTHDQLQHVPSQTNSRLVPFISPSRFPSGGQGSGSGSGGPGLYREEGNDDLYQWQNHIRTAAQCFLLPLLCLASLKEWK